MIFKSLLNFSKIHKYLFDRVKLNAKRKCDVEYLMKKCLTGYLKKYLTIWIIIM